MSVDDHGYSPFRHALESHDMMIQQLAIHKGKMFDMCDSRTGSILHHRWVDRDIRLLRRLARKLPAGRVQNFVDYRSTNYGTPLYNAAVGGQLEIVKFLVGLDAGLDVEGGRYGTALMAASEYGRFSIVKFLVRRGADIMCDSSVGQNNAILRARLYPQIVRWLLVERHTEQPKLIYSCSKRPGSLKS